VEILQDLTVDFVLDQLGSTAKEAVSDARIFKIAGSVWQMEPTVGGALKLLSATDLPSLLTIPLEDAKQLRLARATFILLVANVLPLHFVNTAWATKNVSVPALNATLVLDTIKLLADALVPQIQIVHHVEMLMDVSGAPTLVFAHLWEL